ncbi:hypothetical protein [Haliovirga abyssi]|uniref:GspL periplasmic domain-containing protein n=1 Tax=Haliovirga abyssi TaxID=2996794 RepID=A0AAU9DGH0_9FUSO|nr:hypothetical protein [Haliovirga abyssi]BDU49784.1 hypothetical protein HLVA_03530 [Haliovirga abyssi]
MKNKAFIEIGKDNIRVINKEGAKQASWNEVSKWIFKNNYQEIDIIISPEKVFVKSLELPSKLSGKIENLIKLKVINELPLKEKDVYYTYSTRKINKKNIEVAVFIIEKAFIDNINSFFEERNVKIKSILPLNLLGYNYYLNNYNNKLRLYADVAEKYIQFYFFYEKKAFFRKSIRIDEYELECKKTIKYIKEKFGIEKNIEIIKGNIDIKYYKYFDISKKKSENSIFNTKGVESVKKKELKKIYVLIFIMIIINILTFSLKIYKKKLYLKEITKINDSLQPIVKNIETIKKEYNEKLVKEEKFKNKLKDKSSSYLKWIKEIGDKLPKGTVIDQVIFKDNRLALLSGKAVSATEVMRKMEKSKKFKNLKFIGSIVSSRGQELFKIEGDLADEKTE